MKKLFNQWKWLTVAGAIITIAIGVVFFIFCTNNDFSTNVLPIILGSVIILYGALFLLGSWLDGKDGFAPSFVAGAACISFGIIFLTTLRTAFMETLVMFFGTYILVIGAVLLINGIYFTIKRTKYGNMFILMYVVAAILIALGIVLICFYSESWVKTVIICVIASVLVLGGIGEIVQVVRVANAAKKAKKAAENTTVVVVNTTAVEDKTEEPKPEEKSDDGEKGDK